MRDALLAIKDTGILLIKKINVRNLQARGKATKAKQPLRH